MSLLLDAVADWYGSVRIKSRNQKYGCCHRTKASLILQISNPVHIIHV
jgi:hypothetical protein